jgi:hypothetical protein
MNIKFNLNINQGLKWKSFFYLSYY